jgi:hypothetical protein
VRLADGMHYIVECAAPGVAFWPVEIHNVVLKSGRTITVCFVSQTDHTVLYEEKTTETAEPVEPQQNPSEAV